MSNSLRAALIVIILVGMSESGFAQFFNFNSPVITSQKPNPIRILRNEPLTVKFTHLNVTDTDIFVPAYPQGYTLQVLPGDNYTLVDNVITPSLNFLGTLNVHVQVNDGKFDSNIFDLIVEVSNHPPAIVGQEPLNMMRGESISLELSQLQVEDEDNLYPGGFTLTIYDGKNYSVIGNTITPEENFSGDLKVTVSVNDGIDESNKFEIFIDVKKKNEPPVIKYQLPNPIVTNEDQAVTINLDNLFVEDPDNQYPSGFNLTLLPGNDNYTVAENRITPTTNYFGDLLVPATVNDGVVDSDPFNLKIKVNPVNDRPVITGQEAIQVQAEKPATIGLTSVKYTDPDKQTYTLKILPGTGYTVSGQTITTLAGVTNAVKVRVVVNDGIVDSAPYELDVKVIPKSSKPVITGQEYLVVREDESLKLKLEFLFVSDDDDPYPTGFTLYINAGPDYSVNELTVTPKTNITGEITVSVYVHDGQEKSDIFPLKIYVLPVNDRPRIDTLESDVIFYEPGSGPVAVTSKFVSSDNDSEYLSYAEVSFADSTFIPQHDVLLFKNTKQIRGIYDGQQGILSLIGYATTDQYDSAIRTIQYNYLLTVDEEGNQTEIKPGKKLINFWVSDGAESSAVRGRIVSIESSVVLDIPNAFTPDADQQGRNNTWAVRPLTTGNQLDKAVIKVFNKRGLLVYESKGFEKKWDGSFNGEALPVDTYYYTIDLKLTFTKKMYKGTVTILR
jgi:gliding motility-associated-like protein